MSLKFHAQKEAENHYNKALKLNPGHAPSISNLGEIYFAGGNEDRAKQYWNQAVKADGKIVAARNNLAWLLIRDIRDGKASLKSTEPEVYAHKQRRWSALGVIAFALTISFSAFDYLMSLDPHWFSTMFGVYFFTGCALTIFSFLVLILALLLRSGYLTNIVTNEHFHDLGKFMFGFTVFWTYISFSQYFLIWYANIPEETHWFAYRGHGDFLTISIGLVFLRFVLPFFILLRRPLKRNPNQLIIMAVWLLVMEIYELFWAIQPAYNHHLANHFKGIGNYEAAHYYETHALFGGTDIGMIVCFIGVFLAVFGWALNKHALVPVNDPRLQESINHENF